MNMDYMGRAILIESQSMLTDLVDTKIGLSLFLGNSESVKKARGIISEILVEELLSGILNIIVLMDNEKNNLMGYAVIVSAADKYSPVFLQKIWVADEYRGQGLGRNLIKQIAAKSKAKINALVVGDSIGFFKRMGFKDRGFYGGIVTNNPKFSKLDGIYRGTALMTLNVSKKTGIGAFLLTDDDLSNISKALMGY